MAQPFIAEIKIFAGNFAPRNYAFCNGQTLPISQNTALFSLLGTNYGGNGQTTFGLPNLQGKAPLGAGQGPGLSNYNLGQTGGVSSVTLIQSQIPSHTHVANGYGGLANNASPQAAGWAGSAVKPYATPPGTAVQMSPNALATTGGGQPHNNMPPYLALNYLIALQGVFPARN